MKRFGVLLLLVVVAVSGCSLLDLFARNDPYRNVRITTDTFDGVIFNSRNTERTSVQFEFNDPIMDYWTPNEEQVLRLEAGLVDFLESEIAPDDFRYGFWDSLSEYRRQYFGIMFQEDETLIFANYFCDVGYGDWLKDHIMVIDGGECFFQVLYDPWTDTFLQLRINGYA